MGVYEKGNKFINTMPVITIGIVFSVALITLGIFSFTRIAEHRSALYIAACVFTTVWSTVCLIVFVNRARKAVLKH